MPKTTKQQLQKDEIKILNQLQLDSHIKLDNLAQRSGFSRQKVWRMIKKFEKDRSIWGYTAIVEPAILGLERFMISIKRSQITVDKKNMNELAYKRLGKELSVLGVTIESSYYTHGEYDWILIFLAENIFYAKRFADFLTRTYPGLVDKASISQILYVQRYHRIENPDQLTLLDFL